MKPKKSMTSKANIMVCVQVFHALLRFSHNLAPEFPQ